MPLFVLLPAILFIVIGVIAVCCHIFQHGLPQGWNWGQVGLVAVLFGIAVLAIAYNNYDIQRDAPWKDRKVLTGYGVCPADEG